MNSKTSICNLALGYLGQPPISSIEQENEQARWLKLFYNSVRDEVLRTHNWAFASAQKKLVLLQNEPDTRGLYLYKYPADALFIRRVCAGPAAAKAVAFTEEFDLATRQRVLVTRAAQAVAVYTRRVTDETQYDSSFVKCFALALASDTALALTGDVELAARLQQKYTLYVEEARRVNMSENFLCASQADIFSEVR